MSDCAEYGVAVEVNANPHRLDLDWRWHGRALELGCMFSINPDAHSIDELDLTRWGVLMARKGGIPPERVLNSLDLKEITAFLQARRAARSPDRRPRLRQTRDQERVSELEPSFERQRRLWRVSSLAGFVVASMSVMDERRY